MSNTTMTRAEAEAALVAAYPEMTIYLTEQRVRYRPAITTVAGFVSQWDVSTVGARDDEKVRIYRGDTMEQAVRSALADSPTQRQRCDHCGQIGPVGQSTEDTVLCQDCTHRATRVMSEQQPKGAPMNPPDGASFTELPSGRTWDAKGGRWRQSLPF